MKISLRTSVALVGGLMALAAVSAASAQSDVKRAFFDGDSSKAQTAALFGGDSDAIELVGCNSCGDSFCCDTGCGDACGCDTSCCDDCGCGDVCGCGDACGGGLGLSTPGCTSSCFFGAELVYVRANFSQAISYLDQDFTDANQGFTFNQFDFDYDAGYTFYGGWRFCDCNSEIRFAYTNYNSDGSFQSPAQPANGSNIFTAPFEVVTGGAGDVLFGTGSVDLDNYDLGFSRTIPLGSPLCGDGCRADNCCYDPCCWCPAWDITWTGAVRVVDYDSTLNYASDIVSTGTPGLGNRVAQSRVSFQGAGLRTGLLGRRYFGKTGMASAYMKGDISLLVGDLDHSAVGTQFSRHSISCTHVIPVTEIEVGGTIALTNCASISGGYMIAAFHDLGHRAEYDFGVTGTQLESFDDANILGFDGFFLRGEVAF